MACHSKLCEVLPAEYGYVIFTAVGSQFVNMWLAFNVMKARKEHNIKFPTLYAADNDKFNCVQRAHQNTLETYPSTLFFLLVGGLQYPRVAVAGGVVYILGRIAFALGYYTGDPEKRRWGGFGYIGVFALIGSTLSFAAHQLKLVK